LKFKETYTGQEIYHVGSDRKANVVERIPKSEWDGLIIVKYCDETELDPIRRNPAEFYVKKKKLAA